MSKKSNLAFCLRGVFPWCTRLLVGIGIGLMLSTSGWSQETLPPLQGTTGPQDLEALWKDFDPQKEPLDVEVLREWEEDGVVLKVMRYRIGTFKGEKAMMAGVFGYPKGAAKLPGLVNIHGGGQYADYKSVLTNAKRGYASITISWAGRIAAPGYTVSPPIVKLFWDGKTDDPQYKVTTDWGALDGYHAPAKNKGPNGFVALPHGADWTLDPVQSARNNSWFLCAMGARRALTFLEQQPQVDGDKLGVYGHSMGGKLTVLTAGSDKRVKAAAPSCGGISDRYNEDPVFRATVGDQPYLERITCPTVFLSPANDFHGHINNLIEATAEIQTDDWRVVCTPHINHQDIPSGEVATQLWMDQYLKGSFAWPETPEAHLTLKTKPGVPLFRVTPDTSRPVLGVDVYYTQQGFDDGDKQHMQNRKNRFWHAAKVVPHEGQWFAHLPVFSTDKPLWVYANVTYGLDPAVSGAGYYYGIYKAETFTVSSLLKIVSPDALQSAGVKANLPATRLIESFEGTWAKEWYNEKVSDWGRKTRKLYHPRYAAPAGARLAFEVQAEQGNKLVVGIDKYVHEATVKGGGAWQQVLLSPKDFLDGDGNPLASWEGVAQFRYLAAEHVTSKKDGKTTRRLVGGTWKGVPPKLRNLQWVGP